MKFKKAMSFCLLVALVINCLTFNVYSLENEMSAFDFCSSVFSMVETYDDPQLSSSNNYNLPTNRLIVKSNSNLPLQENYGAICCIEGYKNLHIFQYKTEEQTDFAYNEFLGSNDTIYVEYDFYFNFEETNSNNLNPNSHLSWNSDIAQVDDAFNYLIDRQINLSEIKVGIIDSGLYVGHEKFIGSTRIHDSKFALPNIGTEGTYSSLVDDLNHGTHVTGIIFDNTLENISIYPFRAYVNSISVAYAVLLGAFEAAVASGMDVINISAAGKNKSNNSDCISLCEAIESATANGIVVVVAAGNDRGNADTNYPASCEVAITVAATNKYNQPAISYSASGICVDVASPGTDINSTVPRYWAPYEEDIEAGKIYNPIPQSLYMKKSGTSQAAPLVAALAATLKSINPDATPASIERIIKQSAYVPEDWEENCYGNNYGTGIVNFYNAVQLALKDKTEIIINSDKKFEITPVGWSDSLYYTLDGSEPTPENGVLYTEPLDLSKEVINVIKAASFMGDAQVGETTVYRMTSFKDMKINRGETEKAVSDSYRGKIRWRSDNLAVATVDSEGNVTGVSEGKTNVVATLESGKRIIFNVTVKEQPLYWLIELFEFWLSLFEINI